MTVILVAVPFASMACGFFLGWFGYGLVARRCEAPRGAKPATGQRDGHADDVTNLD